MKSTAGHIALIAILFLLIGLATASAGTINYAYDNAGRLIKADYGDGGKITYRYDNAGNLLREDVTNVTPALGVPTPAEEAQNEGSGQGRYNLGPGFER